MKKFIQLICLLGIGFLLSSCATAPKSQIPMPTITGPRGDTTHIVAPGETFWRISQMYNVPIATIMQVNHLKDPQELKMGQKLIIPQASGLRPVVTLYPSRKWKYIIIHHSGTEEGNSLAFHKAHLNKGWDKGVGRERV